MPKPLYDKKGALCLYIMIFNEEECERNTSCYENIASISIFSFCPFFYYMQDFDTWWQKYYNKDMFDVDVFSEYLTNVFASIQDHFNKGKSTHIKRSKRSKNTLKPSID